MNRFQLIVLDLLHDTVICKDDFYSFNYQESLNISDSTALNERKRLIHNLLEKGYIYEENDLESDYIGLTKIGGGIWEEIFCVNWDLYYEAFTYEFHKEEMKYYIYSTKKQTLFTLIEKLPNVFNESDIKTSKNWQPIYWKDKMDGYFIQITLKEDPPLNKLLPKYRNKNIR